MSPRHAPKPKAKELDYSISGMLRLEMGNKKNRHLSSFMTRPAYAYTSLEQKNVFAQHRCEPCGYYQESEIGDMECTFPWFDPQEHDIAVYDYLPCQEAHHEED